MVQQPVEHVRGTSMGDGSTRRVEQLRARRRTALPPTAAHGRGAGGHRSGRVEALPPPRPQKGTVRRSPRGGGEGERGVEVELRDKFQAKSARAVLATTTTTTTMTRGTRVGQGSRYNEVLPAASLGPEDIRFKAKRRQYVQDSRGRWIKFSPPAPVAQ